MLHFPYTFNELMGMPLSIYRQVKFLSSSIYFFYILLKFRWQLHNQYAGPFINLNEENPGGPL